MPAPLTMPLPANAAPARRTETGFALLELVVVVLIVLVLIAIAMSSFRGTKRAGQFRAAQAAAHSYAEAVESYMADNGQRPPEFGTDWPADPRSVRIGGPLDPMLENKRYLSRAAPEAVSDGLVDLISPAGGPAGTAIPTARATITYERTASDYTFTVRTVGVAGEQVESCVISNAITLPAGSQRCA